MATKPKRVRERGNRADAYDDEAVMRICEIATATGYSYETVRAVLRVAIRALWRAPLYPTRWHVGRQ